MRNNTGKPLMLDLQPFGANSYFDVKFREIIPNEEWEFSAASTSLPIPEGANSTMLNFKTNVPDVPWYTIYASCYVPPRIQVAPPNIVVNPPKPSTHDWPIRIINNGDTPLAVTGISSSVPNFKITYAPPGPPAPGMAPAFAQQAHKTHTITVQTPPNYTAPPYGELIEIRTTDPEKSLIQVRVLPTFNANTPPRPADKPLQLMPVTLAGIPG
jgi:hypothetical protein